MALILSIRVVDGLEDALEHIARYGDHSDAIITEDRATAEAFVAAVDSSAVFINASTRFNDGGQLGLGAEIGGVVHHLVGVQLRDGPRRPVLGQVGRAGAVHHP